MHFCEFTARFSVASSVPGGALPRKMGLNWFMPALAKRSVGSFRGTQGDEGTDECDSEAKWSMKVERILEVGQARSSVSAACRCVPGTRTARPGTAVKARHVVMVDELRMRMPPSSDNEVAAHMAEMDGAKRMLLECMGVAVASVHVMVAKGPPLTRPALPFPFSPFLQISCRVSLERSSVSAHHGYSMRHRKVHA